MPLLYSSRMGISTSTSLRVKTQHVDYREPHSNHRVGQEGSPVAEHGDEADARRRIRHERRARGSGLQCMSGSIRESKRIALRAARKIYRETMSVSSSLSSVGVFPMGAPGCAVFHNTARLSTPSAMLHHAIASHRAAPARFVAGRRRPNIPPSAAVPSRGFASSFVTSHRSFLGPSNASAVIPRRRSLMIARAEGNAGSGAGARTAQKRGNATGGGDPGNSSKQKSGGGGGGRGAVNGRGSLRRVA